MAKISDQPIAAKREELLVLERQIQETQEECTRAEAEPDRIRAAIEEAREQRGEAIARNLDLGSITRTIKKLKDDLELSEDTVKGLGLKLARLYQEREAAEAGLRVPRDVSVTGFDDVQARLLVPALTSVSHMLVEMGQRSVELLLQMVEDRDRTAALRGYREEIVPTLRTRSSTAAPVVP